MSTIKKYKIKYGIFDIEEIKILIINDKKSNNKVHDSNYNSGQIDLYKKYRKFQEEFISELENHNYYTFVYRMDGSIDSLSKNIEQMMTMRYTRIPIYEKSIVNIIGILNMKDFVIEARKVGFDNVDISKLLRKPYFVLESKNTDDLLKELQEDHQHIAILVDEYGGFSGIVTVEDLIEEIVGEIEDEYDPDDEPKLQKIDDHNYIVDGNYIIDDLIDELDLNLNIDDINHDTVSGFILELLGEIPEDNQERSVTINNLIFKITGIKANRVTKIKLTIKEEPEANLED